MMKRLILVGLMIATVSTAATAQAASMKAKYTANCVKFSQRVNPNIRTAASAQKQACECICEKVQALGAGDEDLKTVMQYTREYDFTKLPERPNFEQILQAHVDVHRDLLTTQEMLEAFVKGMMSCSMDSK